MKTTPEDVPVKRSQRLIQCPTRSKNEFLHLSFRIEAYRLNLKVSTSKRGLLLDGGLKRHNFVGEFRNSPL